MQPEELHVYQSCGVVVANRMVLFGGAGVRSRKRQILEVYNCGLESVGTLPSDFSWGACTNFQRQDQVEVAMLCFDLDSPNGCHM